MTSYIKVQRICKMCGAEFTAQKTSTLYCSGVCSKRAYKARKREEKILANNSEVKEHKAKSGRLDDIKLEEREFLSVPQVATLIGCSKQNVYHLINTGQLNAINVMQRKTIIKRSDLDAMLEQSKPEERKEYAINECYTIGETQQKYGISGKALYEIIKRNDVPKFQKGKYVYVPKELIDKIFS